MLPWADNRARASGHARCTACLVSTRRPTWHTRHRRDPAPRRRAVGREIKIATLFSHPHIVRIYEVIKTAENIYVVMEYVKAGELFDYIVEKGRLHEDEARNFFQQVPPLFASPQRRRSRARGTAT